MDHPFSRPVLVRSRILTFLLASWLLSIGMLEIRAAQQDSNDIQQAPKERPYIGAMLCDLTAEEAVAFESKATEGALIWKLTPDSPAARAGVQAGDIIRMVNTNEVKNVDTFIELFSQLKVGDRLNLEIQRGREWRKISLVLAPPGEKPTSRASPTNQSSLPEGLKFSSATEPLSYEHPKRHFRLLLPPDWAIYPGHRGRAVDERFDTLLDHSGKFQVVIWRQSVPAEKGRDQLIQLGDLLGTEGLQYPVVGFGESIEETNWNHLSIQYPEIASQITYSVAMRDKQFWRFEFVSLYIPDDARLPEQLRSVLEAIRFSSKPASNPEGQPQSTLRELPKDLQRLENVFDSQLRSLDVELVSAETPEAVEMEIKSSAGAAVANVLPRTTASAAGLRRGDLIVELGDQEINTPEDVEAFLWRTPVNQLVPMAYTRREQRVTTRLRVAAGSSPLGEYRHPTGDYAFRYFPNWRLHPDARREELTERVYDYLTSRSLNVKLLLFHDHTPAPDPIANLQAFLEKTSQGFLEGYSGWLATDKIPIVFASGMVGRNELQTLYRIAFVVNGQRYEINAFTSPLYDPEKLPPVLQAILGSLEFPK